MRRSLPLTFSESRPMGGVLLKDLLFNEAAVDRIIGEIRRVHPNFRHQAFARDVLAGFPDRELKARIVWVAECLADHLPRGFRAGVRVLVKSLPPPNDPTLSDGDFGHFIYAAYGEFVARYGCTRRDLTASLAALHQITQRFSAEDAIRPFLNAFPEETLARLAVWVEDDHYHVRRLCSEGTRPRLPWSRKIDIPVQVPMALLDRLYADPTRYVTRSVANHLNDVSRVAPALVIATLTRWRNSGRQRPDEIRFIIRHALRTLIKQGDRRALALVGVRAASRVRLRGLSVPRRVTMNTALEVAFSLIAPSTTRVIVDYAITFRDKRGKLGGRKVFKLAETTLSAQTTAAFRKRHPLRARMTTRTLYPGQHQVEVLVNGQCLGRGRFHLDA